MFDSQLVFLALVFFVAMASVYGGALLLRRSDSRRRVRDLAAPGPAAGDPARAGRWVQRVASITAPLGRLAAPDEGYERSNVRLRFVHAGIRNATAPTAFFGLKTVLTLGLPMLALLAIALLGAHQSGNGALTTALAAAALGYYLPNLWLARRIAGRQREIFESFPDALDLMTVCVEAGLGSEAAILRVAEDIQLKSAVLAEEFRLVNLELRAGADRERALRNLAIRTGVDEVDGFVTMISQADRFGTSIAASLRVHADMLRTRRRQRAEEAAAKIALKLLFPLIFCIFPSLMVVLMGPAMIQIYRVMLTTMAGGQ